VKYPGIQKLFELVYHRAGDVYAAAEPDVWDSDKDWWEQSPDVRDKLRHVYKTDIPNFSSRRLIPFLRGIRGSKVPLEPQQMGKVVDGMLDIGVRQAHVGPGVTSRGGFKIVETKPPLPLQTYIHPTMDVDTKLGLPALYHEVAHTVQRPYGRGASEGEAMVPETVASGLARPMASRYWPYRYMLPKAEGGHGPDLRDGDIRGNIVRTREWAKTMADPTSDVGRMYRQYLKSPDIGGFPEGELKEYAHRQGVYFDDPDSIVDLANIDPAIIDSIHDMVDSQQVESKSE